MSTDLQQISALASALIENDRTIERIEHELSDAKEASRGIREESIPMLMHELELESFKLQSGEMLSISREVYASIPLAMKVKAHKWLTDHNFEGIIKTSVESQFGKGEIDKAKILYSKLLEEGFDVAISQTVNSQTLKAFLKEQLEKGEVEIPLDLFGARPCWTTKIKSPKAK